MEKTVRTTTPQGVEECKNITQIPLKEDPSKMVYVVREEISGPIEAKPKNLEGWTKSEYGNYDERFSYCKKYATLEDPEGIGAKTIEALKSILGNV